ncbi:PIN domain-containing protein [Dethiobacter alkaliphilus]|uniref:Nucleic acid-binding protein n=1 Tax=Dethiobacter alkaliphilus AHT 1 TaxID=555088 RepID=C0GDU5_DETAL|nr:PIN domain-containing protein [Dethiobacter alkaliphilus]EEG78578.1 nucleic acid-binding protein [Dethiobacter alkaliphilus AHT 1]
MKRIIDANIVLRFLLNDIPEQAEQCALLLKRLEKNSEQTFLPDIILADIVWTLEKFYRVPKRRIGELLIPIINLRGLRCSSKETIRVALKTYAEKNIDWSDAFVGAQMLASQQYTIYSYDGDFDKIDGITRVVP